MRILLAVGACVCASAVVAVCVFLGVGQGADLGNGGSPRPGLVEGPAPLVVHEWGTFTSFSGSDGVPVSFEPNNTDLPAFVYYQDDENSKAGRLAQGGTVSMETPVMYFYTSKETRASVKVDFPRGWITEWYPFAAAQPTLRNRNAQSPGQSIRWEARLLPGRPERFPRDKTANHYYQSRATDAVPVQTEVVLPENDRDPVLRGGKLVQQEKFLFYRGVGTFPPPVTMRAKAGNKVVVKNASGVPLGGLLLVSVRAGKLGFRALGELGAGAEATATLPEVGAKSTELAEVLERELTAAGLYEKEARAMIKTWDQAWFGEEGNRLLYWVPRTRTDELLPLTIEPKPTQVVRVLVGRHDFLTPEQEAQAERQLQRSQAAQAELQAAERELSRLGRFAYQARQMAEKRLETREAAK